VWAAGAGASAYLLMRLLSASPRLAEITVGSGALPGTWLSRATGAVPVTVAEALVLGYAGWLAVPGIAAALDVARKNRRFRNALAGGALRLTRDAGILLALFYLLWGFNYARPSWAAQAGWPEWDGADPDEIAAFAEAATAALNATYIELHGSEDAGEPTILRDVARLNDAIDEGWRAAAGRLGLPAAAAARYGRVKFPFSSPVFTHLGVSGMYVPFTGEALVAAGQPAIVVPVTMAHEKAHQRGYTGEGDASFLGFVAAALAPDPLARYSAAYYAHAQLLSALSGVDRDAARNLISKRLPGVQRDLEHAADYYQRFEGPAREIGRNVNDRYLRAQGVDQGVRDYRRSVQQIVLHARLFDGEVVPGQPAARMDEF